MPLPPFDDLLPGVIYSSTSGILGASKARFPHLTLATRATCWDRMPPGKTLDLTFEPAFAVGFDVFPGFVAPGQTVPISVFHSVNAPMGTFTILASPGGTSLCLA